MLKKNWLIIPLIILGFYYNYWTIKNADTEMVFDSLIYGFLILLFLIFLVISVSKDFKKFKNKNSWKNFIPTIIGVGILFSFIITNLALEIRDNSPIIIQAGHDGGSNGARFEFRKDGTYKFVNHGGIGADISRGKYELNDSIITLDKNEIGMGIKTNKLSIRNETYGSSITKVIYQIDQQHKIIDKDFRFIINEYKITE